MLRVILSLIVGGVLLASVGFANLFNINSGVSQPGQQDISSGSAVVGSCNGNVEVDITGDGYVQAVQDFIVHLIRINADPTCAGAKVTVQLTKDPATGAPLGGPYTGTLDALGDADINVQAGNIPVKDVKDIHVLIESANPWP